MGEEQVLATKTVQSLRMKRLTQLYFFIIPSVASFVPLFKAKSFQQNIKMQEKAESSIIEKKMNKRAQKGDIVTINFELISKGFVTEPLFDMSGEVSFVLGWGNYLPGLHDLIMNMVEGSSVENINIDAGWGSRNLDLVFQVPKSSVEDFSVEIGTELYVKSHKVIVSAIHDDTIEIDANPPLAGMSYSCSLELLEIELFPEMMLEYSSETPSNKYHVATFGLGCFWGAELAFMREPGVVGTKVGFTQGSTMNPTYDDVCSGVTGHVEAILVIYDSQITSYESLVKLAIERLGDSVYLLNQVGNDVGSQYRSGIYYHNDDQYSKAKKAIQNLGEGCTVELLPAKKFYDADNYHQQYLLKGGQSAKKNAKEFIRCYG